MLSINSLESTKYARQLYKNVQEQIPEVKFEKELPESQKNLVVLLSGNYSENHPEFLKTYLTNEGVAAELKELKKVHLYATSESKLFSRALVYVCDFDSNCSREKIANFGVKVSNDLEAAKMREATIYFDSSFKESVRSDGVGIFASMVVLRSHKFERKSPTTEDKTEKLYKALDLLTFVCDFLDTEDREFKFHTSTFRYTIFAREFAATRANVATTTFVAELSEWMKETYPDLVKVNIIEGEDLAKQGLNLLYNVGRGNDHPARLITLQYNGNKSSEEYTALIGKGIVFDSGGLNIKKVGMEHMYLDKAGAVAVFATMLALLELKYPVNVVVGMGVAENSVDGKSYRPSDIIRSLNGLTVSIGNTDAEGRLALADTMTWVQRNFKVTRMIDLATLTGACVMALGVSTAGLFSNDDEIANSLLKAGELSFESAWRLPITEEHRNSIKHDHADVNSIGNSSFGGACQAAAFLEKFVDKDVKWIHLDIAGPGGAAQDYLCYRSRQTGFGVRLLLRYLLSLSDVQLLEYL